VGWAVAVSPWRHVPNPNDWASSGGLAALPLRFALSAVGVERFRPWLRLLRDRPPLLPFVLNFGLGAILWALPRESRRPRAALGFFVWTALALLTLVPSAGHWSAHLLLFSLAGFYLMLGALSDHFPRAAVVLLPAALFVSGQATLSQ